MPALLFPVSSVCVLSQETPLPIILLERNSVETALDRDMHSLDPPFLSFDFEFIVNSLDICIYMKHTQFSHYNIVI